MDEHRGYIKDVRRTFPSGDVLAEAEVESRSGAGMLPMTVIGPFDKFVREGDWFVMRGSLKPNVYNGRTEHRFVTRDIIPDLPRTKEGFLALLDKTFKSREHGISFEARHAFVEKHGAGGAAKVEKNPELLLEMTSDPDRYGKEIKIAWSRRMGSMLPLRMMEAAGFKSDVAVAVLKKFKDETYQILQSNPYEFLEVKGVNFNLADKLAEQVGIQKSDQRRVSSVLKMIVGRSLSEGNTYISLSDTKALKEELQPFEIEWDAFKDLAQAVTDKEMAERLGVTIFNSKVGKVAQKFETYRNERDIAERLGALVVQRSKLDQERIAKATAEVLSKSEYAFLSEEQKRAVVSSSRECVSILTGGPGTGKSTVSKAISEIAMLTISGPLYMVAPTGKAARRLTEATEQEATTVHKLLDARGEDGQFTFNKSNPLEPGCFVLVDEASMLDTKLTKALLDALPPDGRILFVGDKDQLPSVDAGYVLGDMLTARADNDNRIPSSELTEVFRSKGNNNMIAPYAKEIKEGKFDVYQLDTKTDKGTIFFEMRPDSIVNQVEALYCKLVQDRLFIDPAKDAIILCPMRKGRGGTHEINTRLQAKANPNGARIEGWVKPADLDREEPVPRVKDRVMFTKNDNELNIRNGDVGFIRDVVDVWTKDKQKRIQAIEVVLENNDVVRIPLSIAPFCTVVAYAITGHKSQGSQYACVIMPVSPDHNSMMERTLLYTEWTRAKRYVVLVGDKEVFAAGIQNTASSKRMTLLKTHIEDVLGKVPPQPNLGHMVSAATSTAKATSPQSVPAFLRKPPPSAVPPAMAQPETTKPSLPFKTPKLPSYKVADVAPIPVDEDQDNRPMSPPRSQPFHLPTRR